MAKVCKGCTWSANDMQVPDGCTHPSLYDKEDNIISDVEDRIIEYKEEESCPLKELEFYISEGGFNIMNKDTKNIVVTVGKDDHKNEGDVRLLTQIADIINIKKRGIALNQLSDDMIEIMEELEKSYAWLYYKDFNVNYQNADIREKMTDEEKEYYEQMLVNFSKFNDFMRTNMHLKESPEESLYNSMVKDMESRLEEKKGVIVKVPVGVVFDSEGRVGIVKHLDYAKHIRGRFNQK